MESVTLVVFHETEMPQSLPACVQIDDSSSDIEEESKPDSGFGQHDEPHLFSQLELND